METTHSAKTETVTLARYGQGAPHQVKGYVFGQLVRLAQPYIASYYSDLWHDAAWIEKYLPVPTDDTAQFSFNYAVNDSGTAIGTENNVLAYREHKYRLTYETRRNQRWNELEHYLHIEDVSDTWTPTPIAA